MKALVCDDDVSYREHITARLKAFGEELSVPLTIAEAGTESEIDCLDFSKFDLAFLDVDMGSISGIEVARQLRRARPDAVILFVTNYLEYAPEGYEVQAFRYLLKTKTDEKLKEYLADAIKAFSARRSAFTISIAGEDISIPVEHILYAQAKLRTVEVHLINERCPSYCFYSTLARLEETLCDRGFLRVHKSFVVNMEHIQKLQCSKVLLTDGTLLPVSEKSYADIRRTYMLWRGSHRWTL